MSAPQREEAAVRSQPRSALLPQDNLFEWHFTLRGAPGTDFEGGRYHGRILLPSDYPFKPPDIILLTVRASPSTLTTASFVFNVLCCVCVQPSGRFAVNEKICLSISSFHPKNWQPSWSSTPMHRPSSFANVF
jgi:ubiquitin-conjugating enzyme E2 J1